MKKHDYFMKMIRRNRKQLLSCGFLPSTLTMWAIGQRIPKPEQADKISAVLGISLEKIPKRETVIR